MPFDQVEPNFQMERLSVFPDAFENNQNILYHGTSSRSELSFEENGAIRFFNPIPTEFLENLISLMESLKLIQPETPYASLVDYRTPTRFSLTPISLMAANHALIRNHGGLKGEKVRRAISLIDQYAAQNTLTTEQQDRLNLLAEFRGTLALRGQPMILAFEFTDADIEILEFSSGIIYPTQDLPANKIVAKIILPEDFVLENPPIVVANSRRKAIGYSLTNGTFCNAISNYGLL